jgi:AraC family transcriptional regulator, ethanolamine operon transcriptional activator
MNQATGTEERDGWICEGRFEDIDAQAARYQGYEQRYQQLSRGPFEGRFSSFQVDPELVIHLEMTNRELAATAATPRGRFGACLLADSSPACALNATEFSQDHVVLSPQRHCVEGRMAAGVRIYCMDIANQLFPEDVLPGRLTGVRHDPLQTLALRENIAAGLSAFGSLQGPARYPAAVRSFKSSIADLLWGMAAAPAADEDARYRQYGAARAVRVFQKARDYIHQHLSDGISIVAMCREIGVSRRSLEAAFRSVIGNSPGNFIRALQLNRVRRDLTATADRSSIGVIAARHGIWHWSRFSRYYREMFGELPSHTRAKSVGSRAD